MEHSTSKNTSEDDSDSLLTVKALAASLSPPRIPPIGSAQRELLHGRDPAWWPWHVETPLDKSPFSVHQTMRSSRDTNEAYRRESHNTLHDRLRDRLRNSHRNAAVASTARTRRLPHPHLATGTELSDQLTRLLGVWLPLPWQHHCRDSGLFRTLCDAIAALASPSVAVASPRCLTTYWNLSSQRKSIRYGPHPMQFVDVYLPHDSASKRLVFFVHGGAWGRYA